MIRTTALWPRRAFILSLLLISGKSQSTDQPFTLPDKLQETTRYFIQGAHNELKNVFVESLKEGIPPVIDHTSNTIQKGIAEGIKEGIPAVINEGARALKDQFEETGDAHQAVGNVFKTIGTHFEQQGQGKVAMQKVLKSVGDEFSETGEGRLAVRNTAATTSEYVHKVGTTVGSVITKIFIKNSVISVLSALGIATMWYGSKLLWRYLEHQLKKPKIIIKSSKRGFAHRAKRMFKKKKNRVPLEQAMAFSPDLQKRLQEIVATTKNIHQKINNGAKNVKYRNLFLYGPPGTGKTLFAQTLAKESGMHYALTSGSSFTKKGALEAMDELFAWANKCKGLILIIDEAECLMPDRENLDADSDIYRVMTSFLNYTGTRSNKFMVVMITNRLSIIDEAMHRRIDDLIELPLPDQQQRKAVLQLHVNKILLDTKNSQKAFISTAEQLFSETKIDDIAAKSAGLSNGDLQGIINMIKTDVDATDDGIITEEIIDRAVERVVQKQHILKNTQETDDLIKIQHEPTNKSIGFFTQFTTFVANIIDSLKEKISTLFGTAQSTSAT